MGVFFYTITFLKKEKNYHLNINLAYENYLVPVFNRTFFDNKKEIKKLYDQIIEYFNHTNIKMTKNDLVLFYNTFKAYDLFLPKPYEVRELDLDMNLNSGLTPKEMLFLMYIDHKGIHARKAKYWVAEYHLDIDYTIQHLIELDYLKTDDYLFNLSKATKNELCEVLDKNNISYSGNKPDILKVVKRSFNDETLKSYFTDLYYKLTIKGEEIATINQSLNDFHKSYYRYANQLKIEEFYLIKKRFKDLDAKDVCKMMVDKKNDESLSDFDWDKFFEEEVKSKKEIKDFDDVIQKYTTINKVETKSVSDEEFLNVVYKGNTDKLNKIETLIEPKVNKFIYEEEKIETPIEPAVIVLVDTIETLIEPKIAVIQENKIDEIVNEESHSLEDNTYFVKKGIKEESKEIELEIELIEETKVYKNKSIGKIFFRCFMYASIICLIIIYSLYRFVFN